MKVNVSSGKKISANLTMDLKVTAIEYPKDDLGNPQTIKQLNGKLSKILSRKMDQIIVEIQKANSDILGIGSEVKAYHNEAWKHIDWNKEYPNNTYSHKSKR